MAFLLIEWSVTAQGKSNAHFKCAMIADAVNNLSAHRHPQIGVPMGSPLIRQKFAFMVFLMR
jgi:hypothetical protein